MPGMTLTVLGCQGPYPGPGGATAGYLVEAGGFRLLLDCGSGVLSQLGRHCPPEALDAVVLSHLHHDHIADMGVLGYALQTESSLGRRSGPLPVYATREPAEVFERLRYRDVFAVHPLNPASPPEELVIGPFRARFAPTVHALPCLAVRLECGGRALAYSADTGWTEAVPELARGAHVFICEASFMEPEEPGKGPGHLTGRQAGEMARRAGVERLLLTHLYPRFDPDALVAQAREVFPAAEACVPGVLYEV
ncbi:MAG: MBL fold metallo-hydrolase [Firmicutes bacterium]|nr:MBL fold metallo-hydrolase [Bacillota bacterium]